MNPRMGASTAPHVMKPPLIQTSSIYLKHSFRLTTA